MNYFVILNGLSRHAGLVAFVHTHYTKSFYNCLLSISLAKIVQIEVHVSNYYFKLMKLWSYFWIFLFTVSIHFYKVETIVSCKM